MASRAKYAVSGKNESVIAEIRRGYGWDAASQFQRAHGLKDERFARMIGVSPRTLTRHRRKGERLDPVASDRFYRLQRVIELAGRVLEDDENALTWLRRPQPGLGGAVPLDLLDTEPGSERVRGLLTQLEYGVLP